MAFIQEGQCLCGKVHYQITAEPLFTHACHCTHCQKITGTSYWLSMFVLAKDFKITQGAPAVATPPQKYGIAHKHYCSDCNCNIYGTHSMLPDIVLPATGTFNDTTWFTPQANIYVSSKQPWVKLDKDVPQFEKLYQRDEVWPKASITRLDTYLTDAYF